MRFSNSTVSLRDLTYPTLGQITAFVTPKKIVFGSGSRGELQKEIRRLGGVKPLIVTHQESSLTPYLEELVNSLKADGIDVKVYLERESEPSLDEAENLAVHARTGGFDVIVGLGGGSVMDLCKIASLSVTNPGKIKDYLGLERVPKKGALLICMPTTAGTGSEVTIFSVVTVDNKKRGVTSSYNLPDVALVDPELTVSMPPTLTAGTGMDALSQAVEPITSLAATPLTDAVAFMAVELVGKWLRAAHSDGKNIEARSGMALAATLGGLAFGNGKLTLGHSLAQTFGPLKKIPHGISCGMALPYVMEFYLDAIPERLSLIAAAMEVDIHGMRARNAAIEAIRAVKELSDDMGIPSSLEQVGFDRADLPEIAETCVREQPRPNSPRELTKQSVLEVLEKMWIGRISI